MGKTKHWCKSKLFGDRFRFIKQSRVVNQLLHSARSQYYSDLIGDNCTNQKRLFDIVGKLLHGRDPEPLYPSCASNADLANNFINFFGTKISKICNDIESHSVQQSMQFIDASLSGVRLRKFKCVDYQELLDIIDHLASKTCELDPIPSRLLLDCADRLVPIIMRIVNLSLASCITPPTLKQALTCPLLKKPSLDHQEYKNVRPNFNLPFMSKVIEKVVAKQLADYIDDNNLSEVFQSAYRSNHSTESKLPLLEYTTTLLFQLITEDLLSWCCWISQRRLILSIISNLCCVQDCQFVLAFVTWHLIGSIPTYLTEPSLLKLMMVFLMFKI